MEVDLHASTVFPLKIKLAIVESKAYRINRGWQSWIDHCLTCTHPQPLFQALGSQSMCACCLMPRGKPEAAVIDVLKDWGGQKKRLSIFNFKYSAIAHINIYRYTVGFCCFCKWVQDRTFTMAFWRIPKDKGSMTWLGKRASRATLSHKLWPTRRPAVSFQWVFL